MSARNARRAVFALLLVLAGVKGLPSEAAPAPASMPALASPRDDLSGLPNFAEVTPTLYRGGQPTAEGFAALARMGVKTVVNLRRLHSDAELLRGTGLRLVEIPCNAWHPEDEDLIAFLAVALDPSSQPVFVHCQHGSDRTGYAIAVYRLVVQGMPLGPVLDEMERFGLHEVFAPLVTAYLTDLDATAMAAAVRTTRAPSSELP